VKIPGTRVEDNRLHRASLWLEDFKQARDGQLHGYTSEDFTAMAQELSDACGLGVSGEEVIEAVDFYSENLRQMIFGPSVGISVVTSAGRLDLIDVIRSIWIDGLEHGAATAAGLSGESNEEIVRRGLENG
jgi:hypothetical protein